MSETTERLGRLGFVAKGFLYAVVAFLAIDVARGERPKAKGEEGAIAAVSDEAFGTVLLVLLAIGLAGYAIWRLSVAIVGPRGETGATALVERGASLGLAAAYGTLCAVTIGFLTGSGGGGGGAEPDTVTKTLLDEPYGVAMVVAIGAVLLGVGAYEAHKAITRSFLDDLETNRMNAKTKRTATALGIGGHAALAVISAIVGVFMIKSAIEHDPKEAVGLDGALQHLVTDAFGPALLVVVAVGLFVYAGYSLVEARYRKF